MEGVAEVKVDHTQNRATVKMKPGALFDEAKARELIDQDYKLVDCTQINITQ
jgi:hypothetical protein